MSLAKLHITEKSRKVWTCGNCREEIPKGSKVIRFTVGFRGRPQERCSKPECFPRPSERESSLVSEVYAAQEAFSDQIDDAKSRDDIQSMIDDVKSACESVVSQYEENPLYDSSDDMQERVSQIESAAEALEGWEDSLETEPEEHDPTTWPNADEGQPFEEAHEDWLETARETAKSTVDEMELP